jgi:hypothetical protein
MALEGLAPWGWEFSQEAPETNINESRTQRLKLISRKAGRTLSQDGMR